MRVVLDTNVLVSALLKPHGNPAKILRLILQGDIEIVTNEHIFTEYIDVLRRPRFSLNMDNVQVVMDYLRSVGINAPTLCESFSLPDIDDEPFLEAALSGKAEVLITGNKRHFPKSACKKQKVLSPSEFLGELSKMKVYE
ncbi:MAG: putative toxin-antitoxin system toxin component, PIN family [Pseudomonadota bacterium]